MAPGSPLRGRLDTPRRRFPEHRTSSARISHVLRRRTLSARSTGQYNTRFSPKDKEWHFGRSTISAPRTSRSNDFKWRTNRAASTPRSTDNNWRQKRSYSTWIHKTQRPLMIMSQRTTERGRNLTDIERLIEKRELSQRPRTVGAGRPKSTDSFSKHRQRLVDSVIATRQLRCDIAKTTRKWKMDDGPYIAKKWASDGGNKSKPSRNESLIKTRKRLDETLESIKYIRFGGTQGTIPAPTVLTSSTNDGKVQGNGEKQVTFDEHQNKIFHYQVSPSGSGQSRSTVKSNVSKDIVGSQNKDLETFKHRWSHFQRSRIEENAATGILESSVDTLCKSPQDTSPVSCNGGGDVKERELSSSKNKGTEKDLQIFHGIVSNEKGYTFNESATLNPRMKWSFSWNLLNCREKLKQKENRTGIQDINNILFLKKFCNEEEGTNQETVARTAAQLSTRSSFRILEWKNSFSKQHTSIDHKYKFPRDEVDIKDDESEEDEYDTGRSEEKSVQTSSHSVQKKGILANFLTTLFSDGSNNDDESKRRIKIIIRRRKKKDDYFPCEQKTPRKHQLKMNTNYDEKLIQHCAGFHSKVMCKLESEKTPKPATQPRSHTIKQVRCQATQTLGKEESSDIQIESDITDKKYPFLMKNTQNRGNFGDKLPLSLYHPFSSRGEYYSYDAGFKRDQRTESANFVCTRNVYLSKPSTSHSRWNVNGEVNARARNSLYPSKSGTTVLHSNAGSYITFIKPSEQNLMEDFPIRAEEEEPSPSFSLSVSESGISMRAMGANTRERQRKYYYNTQGKLFSLVHF